MVQKEPRLVTQRVFGWQVKTYFGNVPGLQIKAYVLNKHRGY